MNLFKQFLLGGLFVCIGMQTVHAQDKFTVNDAASFLGNVSAKFNEIENQLFDKGLAALNEMRRRERKLWKKLKRISSTETELLMSQAEEQYNKMQQQLISGYQFKNVPYVPFLDTVRTSVLFLQNYLNDFDKDNISVSDLLRRTTAAVQSLESQLQKSEILKKFLNDRKAVMKAKLKDHGMLKELRRIAKVAYYHQASLSEYKAKLNDSKLVEQKLLSQLRKIPSFQKFMREHSQLASLFRLPGINNSNATTLSELPNLRGLQTREMIQQEFGKSVNLTDPNESYLLQQGFTETQKQLERLMGKFDLSGIKKNEIGDIPDFKVNQERIRTFFQRLEYGFNLQSVRGKNLLPTRSDIGLSLGYKLNQKNVIGIGGVYSLGWGRDIRNIQLTHQGVGLRTFIDVAIVGSIYVSGGYEQHYRSAFQHIEELKSRNLWESQGLLGLTKKFQFKTKMKANLQLLYDLLWKQQIQGTALVFRVGYTLK